MIKPWEIREWAKKHQRLIKEARGSSSRQQPEQLEDSESFLAAYAYMTAHYSSALKAWDQKTEDKGILYEVSEKAEQIKKRLQKSLFGLVVSDSQELSRLLIDYLLICWAFQRYEIPRQITLRDVVEALANDNEQSLYDIETFGLLVWYDVFTGSGTLGFDRRGAVDWIREITLIRMQNKRPTLLVAHVESLGIVGNENGARSVTSPWRENVRHSLGEAWSLLIRDSHVAYLHEADEEKDKRASFLMEISRKARKTGEVANVKSKLRGIS